jgi:hypothetical protein
VVRQYLPVDPAFGLVDVGAGAGLLGEFLARDRPKATYEFVEPIESLRQFLRERYGEEADVADQASFDSAGFVTLLDVLEHQRDDQAFLRDLVGKMQPGSMLLLTVPALDRLWSQWDVNLGHFRRYDESSLRKCTQDLPLVINEVSFLFPELLPLGFLRARRRKVETHSDVGDCAEFPDLPRLVNEGLYAFGSASLALRRHWKMGTSLFMAATVTTS